MTYIHTECRLCPGQPVSWENTLIVRLAYWNKHSTWPTQSWRGWPSHKPPENKQWNTTKSVNRPAQLDTSQSWMCVCFIRLDTILWVCVCVSLGWTLSYECVCVCVCFIRMDTILWVCVCFIRMDTILWVCVCVTLGWTLSYECVCVCVSLGWTLSYECVCVCVSLGWTLSYECVCVSMYCPYLCVWGVQR